MDKPFLILKETAITTLYICKTLFKVMIPISIIMKILAELGLIAYIGKFLSPVMSLAGIPGSYGIAWAAAICTNGYAAAIAFFSIFPDEPITKAQITVLAIIILSSHSLPIECGIATKVGIKLSISLIYRFFMGIASGIVFNFLFSFFNLYNTAPQILLANVNNVKKTLWGWALGEIKIYLTIVAIVFILNLIITILEKSGVLLIIIKILGPFLKLIGIGKDAIPITIIGVILGYSYATGFFIKEAKTGKIEKIEFFYSLNFVSTCHAIIEDNMLMISIGGAAIPIYLGRFIFVYIMCMIIFFFTSRIKEERFFKIFFR
ncbi:MAG: hypothetical protein FWE72_04300 [Spirochaetaceae bacterium]|nr:hypothetical protein [Spirochaetaceae bacterium]